MASHSTTLFMTIFGFFAIPILGAYLLQNALLYYPDNYSLTQLRQAIKTSPVKLWPEADETYRGLITLSGAGDSRGTVVVFHGNAGSASDRMYYVRALEPLGYRVLLAEYPKYGARAGTLGEKSLVADAMSPREQSDKNSPGRSSFGVNRWDVPWQPAWLPRNPSRSMVSF